MYSRFNYTKGSQYGTLLNPNIAGFEKEFATSKKEIQRKLKEFILDNGHIDASALQEEWFPTIKADVFISHSHKDNSIAKALAGWLKTTFGLNSFIDSSVWGYCDELLKEIDNKYCKNRIDSKRFSKGDKETYNYTLRNFTTSHVHTLLSSALSQMIDKTECVIFINTPQSVSISSEIESIKGDSITTSPWIYHELAMTSIIKTTKPMRQHTISESFSHTEIRDSLPQFDYRIDAYLKEMIELTEADLISWEKKKAVNGADSLDKLYELKGLLNKKS